MPDRVMRLRPIRPPHTPHRAAFFQQVLRSRCLNFKYGAHIRDDLAAVAGWQVSKRVPVHGQTLRPPCATVLIFRNQGATRRQREPI